MSTAAGRELSRQSAVAAAVDPPAATDPTPVEPRRNPEPFTLKVRQRFGRGAGQYEQEARLQQAMAWRLARLCSGLPLPAGPRADLGAGTGLLSRALQHHHLELRQRPPLQLDLCPELLACNPLAAGTGPLAGRDACSEGPDELGQDSPDVGDSHDQATGSPGSRQAGTPNGLVWDLNDGLPEGLDRAALLASSFALQWLADPSGSLKQWCRRLRPGGWLVLAVPTAGSFPQWREAAERAGVPCTALALPDADALRQAATGSGLNLHHGQRLRFSRPRQGGLPTLRHLQRLGASASPCQALSTGQLRRLLAHWPGASPLTWEVLLLIAQRQG